MSVSLHDSFADLISIEELQIFLLLFADDTVLFSCSKEGLQILLNKLYNYCSEWGISVNTDKTIIMVFKRGTRTNFAEVYYNNELLKHASKFTCLGMTLTFSGNYSITSMARTRMARLPWMIRTLFSVPTKFFE